MGVSLIQSVLELTMIKLTLLASFAALAAGSADADAFYHGYGYPYAYGYHAYVPFGSSTGLDPITQGLDPVTQGHVVKRSADADAFYAGYGYPYTYGYFLLDPALVWTPSPKVLTQPPKDIFLMDTTIIIE